MAYPKIQFGIRVIGLFLFASLLMNCNNEEEPITMVAEEECDVRTIGGSLKLNGVDVPISIADLEMEERLDGTKLFQFDIGAANSNCSELTSILFTLKNPIGVDAITNDTYNFIHYSDIEAEAEDAQLTGSIFRRNISSDISDGSIIVSGTVDIIINDPMNYTIDIDAEGEDGERLSILITHQF